MQPFETADDAAAVATDMLTEGERLSRLHAQALAESPSSFRRRGVFITSGALDRT